MKNQSGIWIDGTKALVITLKAGKEIIREVVSDIENRNHHALHQGDSGTFMGTHHLNHESKFEERKRHQEFQFLDKVIEEVKDAGEIFIMGPSGMKKKLVRQRWIRLRRKNRIKADKRLPSKISGVASTDYITLNQCVEKVKEFYKI